MKGRSFVRRMAQLLLLLLCAAGTQAQNVTQSGFTGILVPQYMGTGNATRLPVMFRATVTGLAASTSYRYYVQASLATDFGTTSTSGNPLLISASGATYSYSTSPSLSTAGSYETFTTDASGSYTGWFGFVYSSNAKFTAGNVLYPVLVLNAGGTGTAIAARKALDLGINALAFATTAGATNGSFVKVTSGATDKNLAALYDNVAGNGRPLCVTPVENTGAAIASIIAGYSTASGSAGNIIPNNNANGVRRIEQFSVTTGNAVADNQDADGVWPTGPVSTVNPTNGATAITIANADAPLNVATTAVLSSPSPAVPAANLSASSINNPIYRFDLAVSNANATLTGLGITTTGTYTVSEVSSLKCWYQATTPFNAATATLLSTISPVAAAGAQAFASFTRQSIPAASTGYIFITADIAAAPTNGHTIGVSAVAVSDIGLSSKNSFTGTASAGGTQTITTSSPTISLTGTLTGFGNIATGSVSAEQSYTVSGSSLTGNITVSAPANFQVSATSGSGFGSTLILTQSGGTVPSTTIYVRFAPATASGANSGNITHTSSGATTQNQPVSGNAIDAEPATQSAIAFGAVTATSIQVNLTGGTNGAKRLLLVKAGPGGVTGAPSDGVTYTANAVFGSGSQIGTGNYAVYAAVNGGSASVTVTGLTGGTTYSFAVYEYYDNAGTSGAENYNTTAPGTGVKATTQPTYSWNGGTSTDYQVAANWTPARTTPGATDVLSFATGIANTVTNLNTETIGQLSISAGTSVLLQAAAAKTLTVSGTVSIATGAALTLDGANAITVALQTGAVGTVSGAVTVQGGAHRLTATDNNGITFAAGSSFLATGAFAGNPFGTTASAGNNNVVFVSGATYTQNAGSNPFGATAPASVVLFSPGSNFVFTLGGTSTASFAQRSYANFEWNSASAGILTNNSSAGTITGNLLVSSGTFASTGTAGLNIGGNVTVAAGATFDFSPASAGAVTLNGTALQTLTNSGTFNMGANAALAVNNTNGAQLGSSLTLNRLTLTSGRMSLNGNTLTLNDAFAGDAANALRGSSASALVITGNAGTLYFDQTTNGSTNALSGLTVSSGSAALGNACAIYMLLNPAGGTLDLSGQLLTLKSTPAGTSRVAQVTGTLSNATNVTVERYIPQNASREWRLLSGQAVTGTQTIKAAWQEGAAALADPNPGYGTMITSGNATGIGTAQGYDAVSGTSAGSLCTYNSATNQFNVTPSTTNAKALSSEQAYFLFVRGNRTSGLPSNTTVSATTLRSNGTLNQGDKAVTLGTGAFGVAGNPYASAIDFTGISRTNAGNKFWLWDPKLNTNGGYVLFDGNTGFAPSVASGSYPAANTLIPSGEAYFVQVSGGTGSVTMHESDKSTSNSNNGFRTAQSDDRIHVQLQSGSGASAVAIDGLYAIFGGYADSIDSDDAGKPVNTNENLALLRAGQTLTLEARAPVQASDTLFFRMWKMRTKDYQLQLDLSDFTGMQAYLHDRYLRTVFPAATGATSNYPFTVNADSGSYAADRFYLVFERSATTAAGNATALQCPVTLYPNPAGAGYTNLKIDGCLPGTYQVKLTGLQGQTIRQYELRADHNATERVLDLSGVKAGSYLIEVGGPGGFHTVKTILIQ